IVGKDKKCYFYSDTRPERYVGKLGLDSRKLLDYNDGKPVFEEDINKLRGVYLDKNYVDNVEKNKSTLKTNIRGNPLMFEFREDTDKKGVYSIDGTFDFHQGGYGGQIESIVNNSDGSFTIRYKSDYGEENNFERYEIIKDGPIEKDPLPNGMSYVSKYVDDKKNATYIKSAVYNWDNFTDAVISDRLLKGIWVDDDNITWVFKDINVIIDGEKSRLKIGIDNGDPRDCDYLLINDTQYGFEIKDDTLTLYLIDKSKDYGTFKTNTVYKKLHRIKG
ncbi:MAG TPA: hypothetical protein VF941_05040, partial [Clostridia bacterium]